MVVGNIEMTFPLPGTGYDRTLRVFTFLDGGNVWGDEGNSIRRERLALRLRCRVSSGSRRSARSSCSWVSRSSKHTGDQYQKFQFQIGTSF